MPDYTHILNFIKLFAKTLTFYEVKYIYLSFKRNTIIAITVLFFNTTFSQNGNLSEVIINIAEELASDVSEQEAVSVFVERLHELVENPVMINNADKNEISRLFFLSDFQIRSLISHIKSSGEIVSVYEIATISGFDRTITEIMIPFISLDPETGHATDSVLWKNAFMLNMITRPGDKDLAALGTQWKVLTKYRVSAGKFAGGMTAEKDPGEKLFSGSPPQPDFLSGYLLYSGHGLIKKIIAGDFSVRFGQGTNINTGMRTRLPLTSSGYLSGRDEIRPYTSTDENNFFRGVAGTLSLKNLELSLFFSRNRVDANLGISDDSTFRFAESLFTSGLHDSPSLLSRKDAITSTSYGTDLTYNFKSLKTGIVWSGSWFSIPFIIDDSAPENLYGFSGKKNSIYTVYYTSQIRRLLLFGEISTNDFRNSALVQGLTLKPSDRLTVNVLYRNYAPGFKTFYGRGPGYGTSTVNEYGLLGNFIFEAAKHFFILAGGDICYSPWLKYRSSTLSTAKRYEVRLSYSPSDIINIDFSYNFRFSTLDSKEESGIPSVVENITHLFKGTVRYFPYANFSLLTRIDYRISQPGAGRGVLIMEDLNYRFINLPVTLWLRYCIYHTSDWNSRLYVYENDLLYSYNIPAFSGKGSRSYIMAEWEIGDFAELRIKYGLTSVLSSRSEYEETDELRLQFRIWF